jgi:hypothetical protein
LDEAVGSFKDGQMGAGIPSRALLITGPAGSGAPEWVGHLVPRLLQSLRGPTRDYGKVFAAEGCAVVEFKEQGLVARLLIARDLTSGEVAVRVEVEDGVAARVALGVAPALWLGLFFGIRWLFGGAFGNLTGLVGGFVLALLLSFGLFRAVRLWRTGRDLSGTPSDLVASGALARVERAAESLGCRTTAATVALPGYDGPAPKVSAGSVLERLAAGDGESWTQLLREALSSVAR